MSTPSFLSNQGSTNFTLNGFVPLASESEDLSLPVLDVSTNHGFRLPLKFYNMPRHRMVLVH